MRVDPLDGRAEFLAWCELQSISLFQCELQHYQQTGRGIGASADIQEGDVILNVPDDAVLMPDTCSVAKPQCSLLLQMDSNSLSSKVQELQKAKLTNSSSGCHAELSGLTIALMFEASLGSESRWAEYIHFLPKSCPGLPLFWAAEDLQRLRGSSALDKMTGRGCSYARALEQPTEVAERYASTVAPFLKSCPRIADVLPPSDVGTQALYLWSTAMISSYSFTIGDDRFQAMVPVWDAVNHVTGKCNTRLHHCAESGALQMIATAHIAKGQQVVNDFGPLSNAELLRRYGFVECSTNPHDCVEFSYEDVVQWCERWKAESAQQPRQFQNPDCVTQSSMDSGPSKQYVAEECSASAFARRAASNLASCSQRQAGIKGSSVVPTAWQERLLPRNGWLRISAAGVPEPQLLEAVRLHCLPEKDLLRFLRQLSSCPGTGEALTDGAPGMPTGFRECLQFIIKACKAQYGLSGAQRIRVHETAVHAKRTGLSASLSNQQAASVVVSGELQCLEKLEDYLTFMSPQSLVEHSLSAWQRRRQTKQRRMTMLQT